MKCTWNSHCRASWKEHGRILPQLEWARANIRNRQSPSKRSTRLFAPTPEVISNGTPMPASGAAVGAMIRVGRIDAGVSIHGGGLNDLWLHRKGFIWRPESPPTISSTPALETALQKYGPNSRVRKGYDRIKRTIESGIPSELSALSKNWQDVDKHTDQLLQYWGVHHLYLDKKVRDKVLLAHMDLLSQDVTFLDIRDKPKGAGWFDRAIIHLLVEHCPEGDWIEIRGIDGLSVDYADCEIYHLQNAGLIPIFKVGGKFVMPHPLFLRGQGILNRMAKENRAEEDHDPHASGE